ncbi:uncharacterized protein LY89DRAFT_677923 [Mollisia scopiformis]|uniref:Aminoglycoside phosphotransferase domain-containing protein n=1 Tax=Mollisia scopiformis TaxID=149040 RepID=A0A132B4H4_MOLSC|nr:uncharacterized protein LY89DRAFT_677923 [Mollisia scopiformis]KUJ07302.1 hypothetical protein LY89DRAFT_677923 [Mollisia scopiformis]
MSDSEKVFKPNKILMNRFLKSIFLNKLHPDLDLHIPAAATPHFALLVSTFHPERLHCQIEGGFLHGSYNVGQKVVFSDGTAWLVRFPRVGNVCDEYGDEKVAMEVEALSLIREKTTIPVPQIKGWGLAASNPLDLGPFIIMDFIEGVSLNSLLKDPDAELDTRLMKEDISDNDIEFIYRQFANFLLQLFKLDFDRIGSLPSPKTKFPVSIRPMTFKAHDIMQTGGVNTFGDRSKGFSTATDYFQYVVGQDWEQLLHQPNSIAGEWDARAKYASFSVLKSLIPDYIDMEYDRGPFKLICDDLGLANMIVKSKEDLTIIGMVDLEWSYIGPAQLFGSAPWWLLQDRLTNWDTSLDKESPEIVARFFKYLEIFKRVLEEEEEEKCQATKRKSSRTSCSGIEKWQQQKEEFYETEGMETFVTQKLTQLTQYEEDFEKAKAHKADMDNREMTRGNFMDTLLSWMKMLA